MDSFCRGSTIPFSLAPLQPSLAPGPASSASFCVYVLLLWLMVRVATLFQPWDTFHWAESPVKELCKRRKGLSDMVQGGGWGKENSDLVSLT